MPRPREYASNAERQAAYRQRHADRQQPRQEYLAALARSLHSVLQDAVDTGCSPLPVELLGRRADETMRKLIFYVRASIDASTERLGKEG